MSDPENLVLVPLREIRADLETIRSDLAALKDGQTEMKREISDLREANASMIGYVHQVGLKQSRIDRELIGLHNRVTALEVTTGATPQQ